MNQKTKNFFGRLRDYYHKVGEVLRGDAEAASVFPNPTDVGISRERIYAEFLLQHAPSKCNVFLGGFLFGEDGSESNQVDVIITTDTTPRYDLHNKDGKGKAFSPVEGTLGVASIKSYLDKAQLFEALENIASIPSVMSLEGRQLLTIQIPDYSDWPYKVIYATDGLKPETILQHMNAFYGENPQIPLTSRPNVVHVAGRYACFRMGSGGGKLVNRTTGETVAAAIGSFQCVTTDPDLEAITFVLHNLQVRAAASNHILFSYGEHINRVLAASLSPLPPAPAGSPDRSHID
jgi:hypothetical protein